MRTRAERFETLYTSQYAAVSSYVRRRVPEAEAADVIAKVFVVVWRRLDDVPPPPADRPWLFGVARRQLAEQRRAFSRRVRLLARLGTEPARGVDDGADPRADPRHAAVRAAMARLRPGDREVLRMLLWDGCSQVEAAAVLGCSANAVELRFRRAKERLRRTLSLPAAAEPVAASADWRTEP